LKYHLLQGRAFSSGAAWEASPKLHVPLPVVKEYVKRGLMGKPPIPTSDGADMVLKNFVLCCLKFPKPSICAVNGLSVGVAVNFAWFCHDYVIASPQAKFRYPFSELGIVPEASSSLLLPQLVGLVAAKSIFILGDWIPADEAHRLGLVQETVPPNELLKRAIAVARKSARKSRVSVGLIKQLVAQDYINAYNNPHRLSTTNATHLYF